MQQQLGPISDDEAPGAGVSRAAAEQYVQLHAQLPESIPWEAFVERVDGTSLNKQFACTADSCEVVDVS